MILEGYCGIGILIDAQRFAMLYRLFLDDPTNEDRQPPQSSMAADTHTTWFLNWQGHNIDLCLDHPVTNSNTRHICSVILMGSHEVKESRFLDTGEDSSLPIGQHSPIYRIT